VNDRIVAVDTTSQWGSLALIEGGKLAGECAVHSENGFGHLLYQELEALLARQGWALAEVGCFAAAAGPGSFTGIRVGLAAVKGLAEALEKRVVAVSNLQAIAWHGSAPRRAAVLDARRGEIYGGVYSDSLEVLQPETVEDLPGWLSRLPRDGVEVLSTDLQPFAEALDSAEFASLPRRETPRALAGAVGLIASGRLGTGSEVSPAAVEANYVRRSDAELFWREW
jgi:tRNA threonylcarbamoyladenosine biosynthesis protein TsaB